MRAEQIKAALSDIASETDPTVKSLNRELAVVALSGAVEMDWSEVLRVASLPEYRNVEECKALVREVAYELKITSPFDPA